MDEITRRKYRLLYFLTNELANKSRLNNKLEEILNDHKLSISNPSLISFKKSFQNMKKLTEIEKKEILMNFEKEINARIEIIKVLERKLTNKTFIKNLSELKQIEEEITKLNEQMEQLLKEYAEDAMDYINNYAKFKSVLDVNQLNYDLNQLQNVLVKMRYEKAEKLYSKYGDEDKIQKLKEEREQLTNQLKQLKLNEQKLLERKRKIDQMNPDLVNEFKDLKEKCKVTEWVLNTLDD